MQAEKEQPRPNQIKIQLSLVFLPTRFVQLACAFTLVHAVQDSRESSRTAG